MSALALPPVEDLDKRSQTAVEKRQTVLECRRVRSVRQQTTRLGKSGGQLPPEAEAARDGHDRPCHRAACHGVIRLTQWDSAAAAGTGHHGRKPRQHFV
ncbi:E3 Ubiquitin-Protein Ligase Hecw2 [Manis pentadactyla]|nr:E3 Ubiquitin-Protein Ligase Hecw2 [Manis pentadactyla]